MSEAIYFWLENNILISKIIEGEALGQMILCLK